MQCAEQGRFALCAQLVDLAHAHRGGIYIQHRAQGGQAQIARRSGPGIAHRQISGAEPQHPLLEGQPRAAEGQPGVERAQLIGEAGGNAAEAVAPLAVAVRRPPRGLPLLVQRQQNDLHPGYGRAAFGVDHAPGNAPLSGGDGALRQCWQPRPLPLRRPRRKAQRQHGAAQRAPHAGTARRGSGHITSSVPRMKAPPPIQIQLTRGL